MAGFWERMLNISSYDPAQMVLPDPFEPFMSTGGIPVMDPGSPLELWTRTDVERFWRSQPNLRKVIGFAARNVASIPLHTHERVSDTDRRRVTDHVLARTLSRPQPRVGAFRFWESVLSDGLLYDRWAVLKDYQLDGSVQLLHIPSWRLRFETDQFNRVVSAAMWEGTSSGIADDGSGWRALDLDSLIFDHGYAPRTAGLSPVETLKDLLDESAESVQFRRDVWKNGGRASQYIKRPMDAKWTPEQRNRFVEGLRKFLKGGTSSGGMMLLEDGMEAGTIPFPNSADVMDLEGRTLTATEVASAFYIAPELIGIREGNFSNVDAFRQSLYRDSLGPYITAWEQAVNHGLADELSDGRNLYVEANVEAKLRGSFQEQAQILSTATGRPWMVTDEARSRMNLPALGGDAAELVTPLNVLIGGQASPHDSGEQNLRSYSDGLSKLADTVRGFVKSDDAAFYEVKGPKDTEVPEDEQAPVARVFRKHFERQRRAVLSALGSKDADWWDGDRWDDELSDDLLDVSLTVSERAALTALEKLGVEAGAYSVARTRAFLKKVSDRIAGSVNAATLAALEDALSNPDMEPSQVFDEAVESRAGMSGMTAAATFIGFGALEAARQTRPQARKRWQVNSGSPRASHAALDGEEVGIDEDFSNGLPWPGSFSGDVDEVANCHCSVVVIRP